MSMRPDPNVRRAFLQRTAAGVFAFGAGATTLMLTPRQARARALPLKVLSEHEATTIEMIGDVYAEGATEAGLIHFIDQQLSIDPNDALLVARYFNVEAPYAAFYKAAVVALDAAAQAAHGKAFIELASADAEKLATGLLAGDPPGWQGPPAPVVYLVLRSDAIDVVFGTVEGFERLGVPYMPHILPPTKW
jgi:hypothetical protein